MTAHITAATSFSKGGAILMFGGSDSGVSNNSTPLAIFNTFSDSTNSLIKKWYPNAYTPDANSQTPHAGAFYSMVKFLPKLSHVSAVTIVYPKTGQTGTTQEMTANIYFNQSTTAWNASALSITRDDGNRGYYYKQVGKDGVNAIQIGLNYATGSGLSTTKIHPMYAVVEHEETTKKI